MNIFNDVLSTITPADINQLCADGAGEGIRLELKSDLPAKKGLGHDDWHNGRSVGEYARNQIAEEIIAFANTSGGVVLIGIDETSDQPHRADKPRPLPRVHDLARRLSQAVRDVIEPPPPLLEAEGIDMGNGMGVVILRVAESRRKPHRHLVNKEVFVRRGDETARIGMREIQELTIRSVAEASRVEATIERRRKKFQGDLLAWKVINETRHGGAQYPAGGMHFVGMPTTAMDLVRVVGRPRLLPSTRGLVAKLSTTVARCVWPFAHSITWKPALRAMTGLYDAVGIRVRAKYLLQTDGLCEIRVFYGNTPDGQQGMFIGWIVAGLAYMMNWIEAIQQESDAVGTEFALAPMIACVGSDAILAEYGVSRFSEARGARIPEGFHEFPILSIASRSEFARQLVLFDEDVWNLAGEDIQPYAPTFQMT